MDNSILSKLDELKIHIKENDPDIMAFTEIKPKNGKIPDESLLNLNGYNYHVNNLDDVTTRGCIIYVRERFESAVIEVEQQRFKDAIWVSVKGSKAAEKILVGCIYRSGTPTTAISNDDNLHTMMRKAAELTGYHSKIIAGDFNLNKITWDPDPVTPDNLNPDSPEVKFVDCLRDTFLHQHITEPTRFRLGHRPTLDDLIFSTEENDIEDVTYNPSIGLSDHITLQCRLKTKLKTTASNRILYKYDSGDYKKMAEMLNIDWENELRDCSTQEAMNRLDKRYKAAEEECIPKTTLAGALTCRIKPSWLSNHALRKVKRKHSAWIRYLNTKDGEDYLRYISKRNEATHACKKARKDFETSLAKECRKNSKGVWKYIKSRKKNSGIPNLKKKDNSFTKTSKEIAETLNEQYYSVFTDEDTSNIPQIPPKQLETPPLDTFTVTHEDVTKGLKNLKTDKSPGIDGIHPRPLKELADVLSTPVTMIFQKSLATGQLPRNWLDAVVSPIFKKGQRCLAENYRPVSLLCILCKLLESIITPQIVNHIKTNHLSCSQQHGFSKGRSTTTNLLEALNIWSEAMMHGIPLDILFLDYSKAFDSVPHRRLVKQVESFGIHGKALEWIDGFLMNRRQKVRANGEISDFKPVKSGVPQGSILGPVLFTIYVNDIPSQLESIISMYADDTKLYAAITSESSINSLKSDLKILEAWAKLMQMRFHPAKCKVMHLGKNNPKTTYQMKTEDGTYHNLEEVEVEKDLGVEVDNKLKFSQHIQSKINKANKVLGCLKHTFKYLNKEIFTLLYKSLVRPHIEYASCIWSPLLKRDQDAIERIQRRATKLVPELRDLPYNMRLQQLNLPTLKYRRRRADLIETYRIMTNQHSINGNCHCSLCPDKQLLDLSSNTRTRGHQYKLKTQLATGARRQFFSTRVTSDWNNLSEDAVTSENVNRFKSSLEKEWSNHDLKFSYTFSY